MELRLGPTQKASRATKFDFPTRFTRVQGYVRYQPFIIFVGPYMEVINYLPFTN